MRATHSRQSADGLHGEANHNDTISDAAASRHTGFTQTPTRVLRARTLSRDARLLYALLLSYAWQDGHCFPGYGHLCADMVANEDTVRKYMRELQAAGLVSQVRRGLGKTNLYLLRDPRTARLEPPEAGPGPLQTPVLEPDAAQTPEPIIIRAQEPEKLEDNKDIRDIDTRFDGDSKGTSPTKESTVRPLSWPGQARLQKDGPEPPLSPTPRAERASATGRQRAVQETEPDIRRLADVLTPLSAEFGDTAPRSSLTFVDNLRRRTGLSPDALADRVQEAATFTRAHPGIATGKRMAYLLRLLEDVVTRGSPSPQPWRSDEGRRRGASAPMATGQSGTGRYTQGAYGVCPDCLSSPHEHDCPRLRQEPAPAESTPVDAPGMLHGQSIRTVQGYG